MSNYTKIVDYAAKDALNTGDPVKLVKGTELGAEYDAIATAIATKANSASPVFTGISSFAVGAVGAPSIYMTGYATTGWYNIGANNWGFAVSGAKVLDVSSTGLAVTGTLSSTGDYKIAGTGIYNAIATNTSLGLFADTNAYAGIKAYGSSHATKANVTELLAGTGVVVGSLSSAGLAVTGTLSATGTSSLARIDQSNGSINFASLGNGSTSWQIGTQTALKPLDIFIGGAVIAQFSDTGLAVTGDVSVSTKTPASAAAAGVAGTITWDANYLYVCTATNTWKRVAIATW